MRMQEIVIVSNDLLATCTVVVAKVDEIQLGISKVNPFGGNIQCQTIRPVYFGGDDGRSERSIHTNSLNSRILSPISPKKPSGAITRIKCQSSGLGDVLINKNHSVCSIGFCNLYCVES